jgi:hypothetical protein
MSNKIIFFKIIYMIINISDYGEYFLSNLSHRYIIQKVGSLVLMPRSASPEREGRLTPPERERREGYQPHSEPSVVCLLYISIAKAGGYVK